MDIAWKAIEIALIILGYTWCYTSKNHGDTTWFEERRASALWPFIIPAVFVASAYGLIQTTHALNPHPVGPQPAA